MNRKADTPSDLIPVLLETRARIVNDGWRPGTWPVNERGHAVETDGGPWTLVDALLACEVTAARYYARLFLAHLAGTDNLVAWNGHPYRTGSEAVALIDKALRVLGAEVPRAKYREPRKHGGGWVVTCIGGGKKREAA